MFRDILENLDSLLVCIPHVTVCYLGAEQRHLYTWLSWSNSQIETLQNLPVVPELSRTQTPLVMTGEAANIVQVLFSSS